MGGNVKGILGTGLVLVGVYELFTISSAGVADSDITNFAIRKATTIGVTLLLGFLLLRSKSPAKKP